MIKLPWHFLVKGAYFYRCHSTSHYTFEMKLTSSSNEAYCNGR